MASWDLNVRTDATHGNFGHVILDLNLITAQVEDVDADFDKDTADGAGLGSKVENNLPGIAKGMFKIKAKYSSTLDFRLQKLKNRQSPFNAAVAKKGLSALSPIEMMPASIGKYSSKFSKKDEVTVDMELGARGDYHNGRIVLSPKTLLSGASGVGPIDDNTTYDEDTTGVTSYGGAAYLWLVDITGGTTPTFTAKVTHSTTSGGTYTDVTGGGFAAASMTNAASRRQLIYIPSTTTVNAFTQISWTVTGSPTSVQALIGFARDYDPTA